MTLPNSVQTGDPGHVEHHNAIKALLDERITAATASATYYTCGVKTGLYYFTPGAISTFSLAADNVSVAPFDLFTSKTVDRIGVEVTTAATAGGLLRLGIFRSDDSGDPGSLLLDAGTVDSTTTGAKEIIISQALTSGRYWLAVMPQTAGCGMRSVTESMFRSEALGNLAYNLGGMAMGMAVGSTALPADFTGSTAQIHGPRIALRAGA